MFDFIRSQSEPTAGYVLQFLKKLNRQERVVEEVKLVLKPHYNKKHVTKDEYKDILRRAVPKVHYYLNSYLIHANAKVCEYVCKCVFFTLSRTKLNFDKIWFTDSL